MDPKWGQRESIHDILSAEQGTDTQLIDILAMERRAERAAVPLVAGDDGTAINGDDAGDAGGPDAGDDGEADTHPARTGAPAGTISEAEAAALRDGTPLGRHTQEQYELTQRFGKQGVTFAHAHGVAAADAARAPDDGAASALLAQLDANHDIAIKELRKRQKQHIANDAHRAPHAADERTQRALEGLQRVACDGVALTRALLAPADGDASLDGTMRELLAAADAGPISPEAVALFGFPTACVYGPLAEIKHGNM